MTEPLKDHLDRARKVLLDLTARNRLLNTPRHKSRGKALEIVDELSDEVFQILVRGGKQMSFLPAPDPDSDDDESDPAPDENLLGQPDEDVDVDERGIARRHTDTKLQTELIDTKLQRKLLSLFYDARTAEEEQGVNILYLAQGFLKWYEAENSDVARYAPLVLVPCTLTRRSAGGRIHLDARDEDVTTNLSLKERLYADFGIELPEIPDTEDLVPSAYFDAVQKAIEGKPRWQLLGDDMVLSFFSFSKFLMYRDLDVESWPADAELESHAVLGKLLRAGFEREDSLWPDEGRIDEHLSPVDMVHVMDADSSQIEAIEEVKSGRNLVIQGPPGTGKSQTITNLIAAAIMQGKSVLFVAEKLAALEVVRARLDGIGLGQMCLELHSRKANKKAVLNELATALEVRAPKLGDLEGQVHQLHKLRRALNAHADSLHTPLEPAGFTSYRILGEIVRHLSQDTPLADFELARALTWTREEFEQRRRTVRRLGDLLKESGPLGEHPWRGVQLKVVLPTDRERLIPQVEALEVTVGALDTTRHRVRQSLSNGPKTLDEATRLAKLAPFLRSAPQLDRSSLADPVWTGDLEPLKQLAAAGARYALLRDSLDDIFRAKAWEWDPSDTRHDLQRFGRSLFRVLRGSYRRARDEFEQMAANPPAKVAARVRVIDDLTAAQALAIRIKESDDLGRRAFGSLWTGKDSDWATLTAIVGWSESVVTIAGPGPILADLSTTEKFDALADSLAELAPRAAALIQSFARVRESVSLDLNAAFGVTEPADLSIEVITERSARWNDGVHRLAEWAPIWQAVSEARDLGLSDLVDRLYQGRAHPKDVKAQFEYAYFEAWMREAMTRHPKLSLFDGRTHAEVVEEFRRMDRKRIELARVEVALAHYKSLPKGEGNIGELGIVRREIKKKRRHLPIRKLISQAGTAIQRIKPVFMMSPLSVAQYLAPGRIEFDLLLIDEASQVQPVDAFGAVLRTKQIVVVGDEKQLPPTSFFGRTAGGEDEGVETVSDLESILGVCSAQGMRDCMLNWHYRSQHQSLIAVSNRHFYGNRLYVVPSPFARSPNLGLKFHYVEDGVFDRGGRADNRVEARRVAQEAIAHARLHPDESLGIGTFSVSQRDAILNELERLWRDELDVKGFFATTKQDSFFVKNLENIQGDERDVVFISVGYGPDESGYCAMNFGPLSNDGGERRLNVLITRARKRCEVFSSLKEGDIDLNRARSEGAKALKEFLGYAESGTFTVGTPTGDGYDSPFEQEVSNAIEAHGYKVVPQVGLAGFYIDLAVVDPDKPGRYLLGIECDGAAYHSSRSARDRDRLRQQVLEDRGWIIHRIWSTDWFKQRKEQLRKTLAAIESARRGVLPVHDDETTADSDPIDAAMRDSDPSAADRSMARVREEPDLFEHGEPFTAIEELIDEPGDSFAIVEYEVADFAIPFEQPIHELPISRLLPVVERVVKIEGPIRGEVVARRVTTLWGLRRTGDRILKATLSALERAVQEGRIRDVGDGFFEVRTNPEHRVRDRSNGPSEVRRPENLPRSELELAVLNIVELHVALQHDELVREVARSLGFKSTSAGLAQVVGDSIRALVDRKLELRDGRYRLL